MTPPLHLPELAELSDESLRDTIGAHLVAGDTFVAEVSDRQVERLRALARQAGRATATSVRTQRSRSSRTSWTVTVRPVGRVPRAQVAHNVDAGMVNST